MVAEGQREPMAEDDAYEQAMAELQSHKESLGGGGGGAEIPFMDQFGRTGEAVHYDDVEPEHADLGGTTGGGTIKPAALPGAVKPPIVKAPPFHSRLQKAIATLGTKPISAQSVRNRVKKAGVADEEWQHARMDEALQGKQQVTPQELAAHHEKNKVEVGEVFRGRTPEQVRRHKELGAMNHQRSTPEQKAEYQSIEAVPESKFHDYQTPGGSNYRELLLTAPEKPQELRAIEGKYGKVNDAQELMDAGASREEAQRWVDLHKSNEQYRGAHWDEPNVLAHVRFNDRTGPNGEKVLHVEEIQSDAHQTARQYGYKSEPMPPVPLQENGLPHGWEIRDMRRSGMGGITDYWVVDQHGHNVAGADSHEEAIEKAKAQPEYHRVLNPEDHRVPDLPFKTSWPELALKRTLYHAAEHGYDRVTLNPGEQINKVLGGDPNSLMGQKKFYDETLPNVMAKLGKQFGGKVEKDQIGGHLKPSNQEMLTRDVIPLYREIVFGDRRSDRHVGQLQIENAFANPTHITHRRFADRLTKEFGKEDVSQLREDIQDSRNPIPVTSMRLTPEMREAILTKGFPHMEAGGTAPGGETVLQPGEVVEPIQGEPWKVPMVPGADPNKDSVVADLDRGDVVVPKSLFPLTKRK